jgi:hypothetical protein
MDITRVYQNKVKTLVALWLTMKEEVKDIGKCYWSTDANTKITAAGDTDPVTLGTHLLKSSYVSGITLCEALSNFFSNTEVSTADYLQTCHKLRYGGAAVPTKLSDATEELGSRMYVVACDAIEIFKECRVILELYSNNEIGDMVANLDVQRMIPGSEMTKDQLSSAITVVEQFKKMLNNEAVSTGDYAASLAKWQNL